MNSFIRRKKLPNSLRSFLKLMKYYLRGIFLLVRDARYVEVISLQGYFVKEFSDFLSNRSQTFLLKNVKTDVREELYWRELHSDELESHVSLAFLAGLLELVSTTDALQGDIIELGTYKGGTTISLAHYLQLIGSKKKVYACDTFAGHPYGTSSKIWMAKSHFSDTNLEHVQRKCELFHVDDRIRLVEGRFEDSLDPALRHEMFSLAFIDCDLYQSAKYSLTWLTSHLTKGGVIVTHDYFSSSDIRKAVHEWCRNNGLKVTLCPVPHICIPVSHALDR